MKVCICSARGRDPECSACPHPTLTPTILDEVSAELNRAKMFKPFNSAHEGYAILLEEVDELKAHVWMNQTKRDLDKMRKEAIQVAAMAVKFVEMMDAGRGRV